MLTTRVNSVLGIEVLAAGAEGAWIGTAFLACRESINDKAREAVLASNGRDTVFTSATDHVIDHGMSRVGWPEGVAVRHRPNEITHAWQGREAELAENPDLMAAYYKRMSSGDPAVAMLYYGQGAGAIGEVKSAKDVVDTLATQALARLRSFEDT